MRLLPLAAVVLLFGCQYRADDQAARYADAAAVARAAGCSGFHPILPDPWAADAGDCAYRGRLLSVEWFNDPGMVGRWRELAVLGPRLFVIGEGWAVKCDPVDCDALRARLGGV